MTSVGSPVVVLVGAPGAGKSTVGAALAERLGVGFRDTDTDVETAAGRSISDIFLTDGEPTFRELEREAVVAAISEHRGVLALGGGAVLDGETRRQLAAVPTVWLQVSTPQAAARTGMNAARPVLLGNVRAQLGTLLKERAPLYAEVSGLAVDTDDRTADLVVEEILESLAELKPRAGSSSLTRNAAHDQGES